MSRYDGTDRYTYPGSDVLINKPGITDPLSLEAFEADATAIRMLELLQAPTPGLFNVDHLCEVHRHLFQDVYDWAGEFRLVDISRGSSRFANFSFIQEYLTKCLTQLSLEASLCGAEPEQFISRLAFYMGEINAVHPFREAYLVALQNVCMTNPLDLAAEYRQQQNWLRGPLRGAVGISYVPPPPEWVPGLMDDLLAFANEAPKQIDPLVCAAVVAFAFGFIHPFMDGNGRLSRFLFHHALCRSGQWGHGLLLPVSVAMKRNEGQYLAALQSYSKPARQAWDVTWLGDDEFDFKFKADASVYRYWDATACVAFALEMAQQALHKDLKDETEFLAQFDALFKAVDERFDVRGNDLTTLVLACLQNKGKVPTNRRKKFADTVPEAVFDAIEAEWQLLFAAT